MWHLSRCALHIDPAFPASHCVIDRRQAQSGADIHLGREEGFEETSASGFVHAYAGVLGDQLNTAVVIGFGAYRDLAAVGHGIDGIQQQVGQNLIQTVESPANVPHGLQFQQHLNGDTG